MTFTSPPTVATGDFYTAAMFNTYTRDNINHLRALLPDASVDYPLVGDTATTASFRKIPNAGLLSQKIEANVAQVATFAALFSTSPDKTGFWEPIGNDGPVSGQDYYAIHIPEASNPAVNGVQLAFNLFDVNEVYIREMNAGVFTSWFKIWHSGNDGSASILDAHLLDNHTGGHATGQVPYSDGALNVTLNADLLDGLNSGHSTGQIPVSDGTVNATLNADTVDGFHAGNGAGAVPINNGTLNTTLNAAQLGGLSAGNASGNVPISNGSLNVNLRAATADSILGVGWFTPVTTNGSSDTTTGAAGTFVDVNGLTFTASRSGYYLVHYYLEINWSGTRVFDAANPPRSPFIGRIMAHATPTRENSCVVYYAAAIHVHPATTNTSQFGPIVLEGTHIIALSATQIGKIQFAENSYCVGAQAINIATKSYMTYTWVGQ